MRIIQSHHASIGANSSDRAQPSDWQPSSRRPWHPRAWAASRDRIVIYQGVSLDSLHPYGYSGGGIIGHLAPVIDPLTVKWTMSRQ